MTKKVLMVGNDLSVHGGITSVISFFLNHNWKKDEVDMEFIPTYIDKSYLQKFGFFLVAFFKIYKYIRLEKPDLIHIHMSYKGSYYRTKLICGLCYKYHVKIIIHLHGSEFVKWYRSVNKNKQEEIKKFLRSIDMLIVLGNKWKKKILQIEPKTKLVVISNAVKIPEENRIRNSTVFNLLYLGVLIPRKGILDLLKAIRLLKYDKNIKNFRLIIAGNGKLYDSLRNKSKDLKINDIVQFVGWVDQEGKEKLFKQAQALILPSYNEGLPMSILEAISYGLPVIASNVGDISAAVIDEKNGYLVEPGNVSELVDCIYKLITNKEKYRNMSRESLHLAIKRFSDNHYFETINLLYKNL